MQLHKPTYQISGDLCLRYKLLTDQNNIIAILKEYEDRGKHIYNTCRAIPRDHYPQLEISSMVIQAIRII